MTEGFDVEVDATAGAAGNAFETATGDEAAETVGGDPSGTAFTFGADGEASDAAPASTDGGTDDASGNADGGTDDATDAASGNADAAPDDVGDAR